MPVEPASVAVLGPVPAPMQRLHPGNDPTFEPDPGDHEAFDRVRAAMRHGADCRVVQELSRALKEASNAGEFRRWLAQALLTADAGRRPLLLAYQAYFNRVAALG